MKRYTCDEILGLDPPPCDQYWDPERTPLQGIFEDRCVESATLAEILRWNEIPAVDRLWLPCHESVLPTIALGIRRAWIALFVTRAILSAQEDSVSPCPRWSTWAERWLSGEDRTGMAAWAAAVEEGGMYPSSSLKRTAFAALAAWEAARGGSESFDARELGRAALAAGSWAEDAVGDAERERQCEDLAKLLEAHHAE